MTFDSDKTQDHGEHEQIVAVSRKETPDLGDLIGSLLEDSDHDREEAARLLTKRAERDKTLRAAVGFETLEQRCQIAVDHHLRKQRQRALRVVGGSPHMGLRDDFRGGGLRASDAHRGCAPSPTYTDSIEAAVAHLKLLDTLTLPQTHKPLRDATQADLVAAASYYESRAAVFGRRGRIFRALAQMLPVGKKAGDALTEDQVRSVVDAG